MCNAELDIINEVSTWYERELLSSQEFKTPQPASGLQIFSGHTTHARICRIITSSDVVPLVNAGVLQKFTNLIQFDMKMGCLFVEFIHCTTMALSVHINTLTTVTVNAHQISLFKRAARRAACISNLWTVITFIGAARALPETNASSVIIFPEVQVKWALRKPTALNTSCDLSANMRSSRCWNGPEKWLLGIVISANRSSSTHQARNVSIVSLDNSSSQLCPLTRQMSFKINHASFKNNQSFNSKRCDKTNWVVDLWHKT